MAKEKKPSESLEEAVQGEVAVEDEAPVVPTAEEMLSQERDRYLRLAAEFDNYRKRTERDMAEFKRRAVDDLLLSLLEVVDNLDRALVATEEQETNDLLAGLRAIRNQMGAILERECIVPIEAVGLEFDPFHMEAVMRIPSEEVEEGHVVSELQKGYRTPTYVLRPSKVVVSSGPKEVADD